MKNHLACFLAIAFLTIALGSDSVAQSYNNNSWHIQQQQQRMIQDQMRRQQQDQLRRQQQDQMRRDQQRRQQREQMVREQQRQRDLKKQARQRDQNKLRKQQNLKPQQATRQKQENLRKNQENLRRQQQKTAQDKAAKRILDERLRRKKQTQINAKKQQDIKNRLKRIQTTQNQKRLIDQQKIKTEKEKKERLNRAALLNTLKSQTALSSGTVTSQQQQNNIKAKLAAIKRDEKNPKAVINKIDGIAKSVNAQSALRTKLSGLEKAQQNAAKTRQLPDGRVRYYTKEVPARTDGPTRGASFVTEHNPKNGNVRQWMESYDHSGQVNRVHPKSINGQTVNSQHYPPTARELGL